MAAGRAKSRRGVGTLMRSKSEGTLIDLSDVSTGEHLNGGFVSHKTPKQFPRDVTPTQNPFWNQLSGSNPFLDDIVHVSADEHQSNGSTTKPDEDAISTSSDEGNLGTFLENKHKASNQSGRWRSASDILDDLARKEPPRGQSFNPPQPVLNPDFEWLKDDREAYKMAWLSHRQLTRSCLDLSLMSQSPGWAQTQATDCQLICKLGSAGGLVQLPGSHICLNIPAGHVAPGEVQEVTLKATLDPPPGLNNNYMTTISPLLEVVLSHINTTECVCVKMKLSGEVRSDPVSQVMTSVVGLLSNKREGPYVKVTDCSVKKNTMEMKLQDLKTHFYVIAVAEASAIQSPATSVWDYLHRHITVAVYGPRYIHPSFKVVVVVCCQEDVPPKLPFSDIGRGNKHLPPLVLHLWGTHRFKSDKLHDLFVAVSIPDATFTVKGEDAMKEVRQSQLRIGAVLHLPVALLCADHTDVLPFKLHLQVQESGGAPAAQFQVASPPAAPIRSEKRVSRQLEKRVELARNSAIPKDGVMDFPKFTDAPVSVRWYAVALKSVLRQPRVEYLLEYFKGDTVALLSRDSVRSVGNSKVKEWYIGFLRGRTGLIHCRNFKVITREQVIDFTGIKITTQVLLDNMALPFNKLTYMYSAIQTLVTEHVSSWRRLADALGYKPSLDAISHRYAESEADEVACVLEKLKEDCHAENSGKKFLHELMVGLLKMDSVSLMTQLIQNTVILSTAVELGVRWRELADKMGKLSSAQIAGYEAPHRGKNGEVGVQAMWKPAYDFLFSWSLRYGNSYRDMIQDLHLVLDKMKNPATRQWRQLTGTLITVNCLDVFRAAAHPQNTQT